METTRFDFGPLEALISPLVTDDTGHQHRDQKVTAQTLGLHPRSVLRLRKTGMSTYRADELAIAAGTHPAVVWGAAWWAGVEA